jgi:hypothetical protein
MRPRRHSRCERRKESTNMRVTCSTNFAYKSNFAQTDDTSELC